VRYAAGTSLITLNSTDGISKPGKGHWKRLRNGVKQSRSTSHEELLVNEVSRLRPLHSEGRPMGVEGLTVSTQRRMPPDLEDTGDAEGLEVAEATEVVIAGAVVVVCTGGFMVRTGIVAVV